MAKKQSWSYTAGEKGRNRVRAFEDSKTGMILLEFYEGELGKPNPKRKRISTKHRDRTKAKRQADDLAAAVGRSEPPPTEELTLRKLFDIYLGEVTPTKGERKQQHDRVCAEMFLRYWGRDRKVSTLSRRDWEKFIRERRVGAVGPAGEPTGRAVGERTVACDLELLRAALNWATEAGDGKGGMLLDRNPLKGLPLPRTESPSRPVLYEEQYSVLLAVAHSMDWRFGVAMVLVHETGHRIGAVRQLRWSDVDFANGSIRWRADNDKIGFEHRTPLTEYALAALQEARSHHLAIGDAWVLPSPADALKPCSRDLVKTWWRRAEKRSGLAPVKGRGWHSLRRKFATERKDQSLRDLCELGGWKNPVTVLRCYQRPDTERMREVLANRKPLRAAEGW